MPRPRVHIAPAACVAFAGTVVLVCLQCLHPTPDNVGRPCMWTLNQQSKYHCVDAYEVHCVPLSTVVNNRTHNLSSEMVAAALHQAVRRGGANGTIRWKWGEPSVCLCESGYTMHNGKCVQTLPKWPDADLVVSIVGTMALCASIVMLLLCHHCNASLCTTGSSSCWADCINGLSFIVFIFLLIYCIRATLMYGQY